MHVSYGLKCALFAVTGCMFKSGRSVKLVSVKVVRVGRSSRFGSVNLCRLVLAYVGLSLWPSSYVDLSLRPSSLAGLCQPV